MTGRCYCGSVWIKANAPPRVVVYCHCSDCRRWTGAPAPAFAAFEVWALQHNGAQTTTGPVNRWNCPDCGSTVAATFDYLPDQVYVPVGLLDRPGDWKPSLHCHAENAISWLHLDDNLPRTTGSAREELAR